MNYFKVILYRSLAPELTYSFDGDIEIGQIVEVPIRNATKKAIVMDRCEKPSFNTLDIISLENKIYSLFQIKIAKFISNYYFSSLSHSLSIFIPFEINQKEPSNYDTIIDYPNLTEAQSKAYLEIKKHKKALLFGVTGAGKSEIFISLVADSLKKNKTAIILMPEISLTPQMGKRLAKYFGSTVAIWHSKLTKKRKEKILDSISKSEIRVIAGARSALFVPLKNIGLIVVDEEHDDSYKSASNPRYNARDLAILMADRLDAKVLLLSATPSLNSYHKLPVIRLTQAFITNKKNYIFKPHTNSITNEILKEIYNNKLLNNQSILFIPTRGNFKYLYCQSCGETHKCPYCSVGMALHRTKRLLLCHYCNFIQRIQESCITCGYHPLSSRRIGTAEAIDIIKNSLSDINIEQFDADTINTPNRLQKALDRVESCESDILVGTQMLSKGHDYPNVTLGIITGLDYMLGIADYRAKSRAMSMMFQISGRCGRAKESKVIIYTNNIETFQEYLGDYERFIQDELLFVEIGEYPPFVSLAKILVANKDFKKAEDIINRTVLKLQTIKDIEIVGYGKAPIEKIANRYRYNILLKAKNRVLLLKALHSINSKDIEIDMDPIDFS